MALWRYLAESVFCGTAQRPILPNIFAMPLFPHVLSNFSHNEVELHWDLTNGRPHKDTSSIIQPPESSKKGVVFLSNNFYASRANIECKELALIPVPIARFWSVQILS